MATGLNGERIPEFWNLIARADNEYRYCGFQSDIRAWLKNIIHIG